MKRIIFIIMLILTLTIQLFAGEAGSAAMTFLNVAPNARVASMGESFVAWANDVSAVYWNPAGLSSLKNMEVAANYNIYFVDTSYFNVMFTKKFNFGSFGVNLAMFNYGSIDNYVEGVLSDSISPSDFSIHIAYSKEAIPNLYVGGGIKFVSESLSDEYSGTGIGIDMGVLYLNPLGIWIKKNFIKPLRFGFTIQNLGIGPSYAVERNSLPLTIKAGFGYRYRFPHSVAKLKDINFSLDFVIPTDSSFGIRYGTELWWYNLPGNIDVAFRVGLKVPQDLGFTSGLTGGIGIRVYGVEIDYALVNFGDLGLTHRIGIDYKFGKIEKPAEIYIPEKKEEGKAVKKSNKKEEKSIEEDNFEEDNDLDTGEEDFDIEE